MMLLGILLLIFFITLFFLVYHLKDVSLNEEDEIQSSEINENNVKQIEQKPFHAQYEKIKYWLYDSLKDLDSVYRTIYRDIVVKNLWIDEPFHTKFYEVLLLLSKNDFMIKDKDSNTIVMNIRDENEIVQISNSYSVFSTNEILSSTFEETRDKIKSFNDNDAKNILFAMLVIVCSKSQFFNDKEVPFTLIMKALEDYKQIDKVLYIVKLIEQGDKKVAFVKKAYDLAIRLAKTYPYNDSITPQQLQICHKLPKKILRNI